MLGVGEPTPRPVDWNGVVDSLASAAVKSIFETAQGRRILSELVEADESGLSFSDLEHRLNVSASSLANALTSLQQGGVIENELRRRPGTRVFSMYRPSALGRIAMTEIGSMYRSISRRIAERSGALEVARALRTSVERRFEKTPFGGAREVVFFERPEEAMLADLGTREWERSQPLATLFAAIGPRYAYSYSPYGMPKLFRPMAPFDQYEE